jgi:hypothetical protein
MKSLYNTLDNQEVVNRITKLTPHAVPNWGKMNVAQMMAHINVTMKTVFGEIKFKRSLIGILFGNKYKNKLTSTEEAFARGLPTSKKFVTIADQKDFEAEKKNLITYIQKFSQLGPDGVSKDPHPFFGYMNPQQWDTLVWKHLDHHLRQFGV